MRSFKRIVESQDQIRANLSQAHRDLETAARKAMSDYEGRHMIPTSLTFEQAQAAVDAWNAVAPFSLQLRSVK